MSIRIYLSVLSVLAVAWPCLSPGQAKIVGGSKAPENDYKWIAALSRASGGSLYARQFCGASLIAPDWVVTAAHCVEGDLPRKLQVVVGLSDLNDTTGAEIRGVKGIFIHPNYEEKNGDLFNDIALLLLSAPVTTITPIAYARPSDLPPVGTSLRVLGWGETQATPRYPTLLQMTDLKLTSLAVANRYYGGVLNLRHLAAMATGKDTCGGDSGGPLFEKEGNHGEPLLQGITSYGIGCAESRIPGIYTNVSNYATWLDRFLAQPTTGEPVMTVYGRKGLKIPNRVRGTSVKRGTNFGRPLGSGQTVTKSFVIENQGKGLPISFPRTRVSSRHFKVVSSPNYLFKGKRGKIRIRFKAPSMPRAGAVRAVVRINSSDPKKARYAFALLARYKRNPQSK